VTQVGKILVIVITCFSLMFMAFAVMVFATRKNWMDEWRVVTGDLTKANEKKAALEQQIKALGDALALEVDSHKKAHDLFVGQIKDQKSAYDRLLADYKQAREDVVKYEQQTKLAIAEAGDRREEATRLRGMLSDTQEKKEEVTREKFRIEQDYIELQGNHETALARLQQLQTRSAELQAILESYNLSTNTKDHEKSILVNPPPVEGIVMKVDNVGKYVEISVGSDDGLRKGHRLQVYRVKPQGKYVGQIEIIEVDPERAVARILSSFKQTNIQEGDLVANRITASR
jgi:hypothetical protein